MQLPLEERLKGTENRNYYIVISKSAAAAASTHSL